MPTKSQAKSKSMSRRDQDDEEASPRKRQKVGAARFVDLAAVSDDDGGDDEDYEEGFEDFIEDASDVEEESGHRDVYGYLKRRSGAETDNEEDTRTPEEVAREIAARSAAQRKALLSTGAANEVPQRLLIPSIQDPSLWMVKVKPGRERELVFRLMGKSMDLALAAHPLQILSVFSRDSIQGAIYIEARLAEHVTAACNGMVGIFHARFGVQLVPIEERAALLSLTPQEVDLFPGSWVRIRRGTYRGDLAQVVEVIEPGEFITIRFVPRINSNPLDVAALDNEDALTKKKKRAKSFMGWVFSKKDVQRSARPQQKLFNPSDVALVYGADSVVRRNQVFIFQGEMFKDGFVERDVRRKQLIWENVEPTLWELTQFGAGDKQRDGDIDMTALKEQAQDVAIAGFRPGDRVEVFEGEQAGMHGYIAAIQKDVVTLSVRGHEDGVENIDAPAGVVRKFFKNGDHVKVIAGHSSGETGLVVSVHQGVVTFLSDMDLQEIAVLSKDVREAAEIGSGTNAVGELELHQLVQLDQVTAGLIFKAESSTLRVLDENNFVRLVYPAQIPMIIQPTRDECAQTATGSMIRPGDQVKELLPGTGSYGIGPRNGRVMRILARPTKSFVFVYSRELQKINNGIFVLDAAQLTAEVPHDEPRTGVPPKSPSLRDGSSAQGEAPAPASAEFAKASSLRDRLKGANVVITRGPFKGYAGVVVETNAQKVRVELQAGNQVKIFDMDALKLRTESGKLEDLSAYRPPPTSFRRLGSESTESFDPSFPAGSVRSSSSPANSRMPPPSAWGGGGSAWSGGGKTPSGNIWSGGKTPNPYVQDLAAGGKTPAWSTSSKTPNPYNKSSGSAAAFGFGGKTPGWGGAGVTPNVNAWGGKTPGWGGAGAPPNDNAWGGGAGGWSASPKATTTGPSVFGGGGATPAWGGGNSGSGGWGASPQAAAATAAASDWGDASGGWGATPAWHSEAKMPETAPTPALNSVQTPAPFAPGAQSPSWSPGVDGFGFPDSFAAPTPAPALPARFSPPEDWLFDPAYAENLSRIMVVVQGTSTTYPNYLDGAYEGRLAQVVVARRLPDASFEQTAMLKFSDGEQRTAFPARYVVPAEPSRETLGSRGAVGAEAIVLDDEKFGLRGKVVRLRELPEGEDMRVLVTAIGEYEVLELSRDRLALLGGVRALEEGEIMG
ncbi:hypothetical protein MKEN_00460700 [Mycena kentingensis (nom. inval.)]|nr:hypothetical protein MKEN_00460700 [Mycena kentingensis (nom. inval.)]